MTDFVWGLDSKRNVVMVPYVRGSDRDQHVTIAEYGDFEGETYYAKTGFSGGHMAHPDDEVPRWDLFTTALWETCGHCAHKFEWVIHYPTWREASEGHQIVVRYLANRISDQIDPDELRVLLGLREDEHDRLQPA